MLVIKDSDGVKRIVPSFDSPVVAGKTVSIRDRKYDLVANVDTMQAALQIVRGEKCAVSSAQ